MIGSWIVFPLLLLVLWPSGINAEDDPSAAATPVRATARMPVREVAVFKDGHAFVRREGEMPVTEEGAVVLDDLPAPILGTFWPYVPAAAPGGVNPAGWKLASVVAGRRRVLVERTALGLPDLVAANADGDAEVTITDVDNKTWNAFLQGVPKRTVAEQIASEPPGGAENLLPILGDVVFLRTTEGVQVLGRDRIRSILFKKPPKPTIGQEELRPLLTLNLNNPDQTAPRPKNALVGMMYVQKGLRWIPNYKIDIDGKGQAKVTLQATLVNDLADLDQVTAHLVVGVPSFAFADQLDPIGLGKTLAAVAARAGNDFGNVYSNGIQSQVAAPLNFRARGEQVQAAADGPEIGGAEKSEDFYLFTVKNVKLRQGQRMTLTIAEQKMKYTDVYTLDVPVTPPQEVRNQWNMDANRMRELAKILSGPKVKHKIRLENAGPHPITTAPGLIVKDGRVLSQGLMTYAAPKAKLDLELTTAVDITHTKVERETKRTPNAVVWQNEQYGRVDLEGTIELKSYHNGPVTVEVKRHVLGNITSAEKEGAVEMLNVFEEGPDILPTWWGLYNWPYWWYHFNGIGRITWNTVLEPNTPVKLSYQWHYFWR